MNSGSAPAPPKAAAIPLHRRRPLVGFCFGLMVLIFLFGTWIKACREPIVIFNFGAPSGSDVCDLKVNHLGYDFAFRRISPLLPGTSGSSGRPIPALFFDESCRRSFWRPVDWLYYSGRSVEVILVHVEHWFLIVAQLTLWSAALSWHRRRLRKGMAAAPGHALD